MVAALHVEEVREGGHIRDTGGASVNFIGDLCRYMMDTAMSIYDTALIAQEEAKSMSIQPAETRLQITLRAARINAGYTQKQAANLLSISEQTLSNYERGISYPDVLRIQDIDCIYDISPDQIKWTL